MAERMDHAAEARRLADLTSASYGHIEVRNGDMAVAQMIEAQMLSVTAQVHATLALVAEQRIANLVAISVSDKTGRVTAEQFASEAIRLLKGERRGD